MKRLSLGMIIDDIALSDKEANAKLLGSTIFRRVKASGGVDGSQRVYQLALGSDRPFVLSFSCHSEQEANALTPVLFLHICQLGCQTVLPEAQFSRLLPKSDSSR